MVINIDNGYILDIRAIKNMLVTIYKNNPEFPIDDTESLIKALGGEDQLLFVNENIGDLPSTKIAEKIFERYIDIKEPNQIIDGIIGQPFVDIITKFKLLDTIYNLPLPIEKKDDFISHTKKLMIYGIPIETIAEKLDYPIEKHDKIINRIKLLDKKLLEANVELIANIKESESAEDVIIEEHSDTLEEILTALQDKEMNLKQKIKLIIEHGKNAYREKNYQKALMIYEKGLDLDQDNTELNFLRKSMQQKLEHEEKTISEPIPAEQNEHQVMEEPSEITSSSTEKIVDEIESDSDATTEPKVESEVEIQHENIEEDEQTKQDLDVLKSAEKDIDLESEKTVSDESLTSEEDKTDFNKFEMDSKIEELGKRLQEKVSLLKNLSTEKDELPEDACKSCEGTGSCYWCKGSGTCKTCAGTGKDEASNDCSGCNGSGQCHSCKGVGKCHWCNGTGEKAS